jgi:transcriptional regulator with XRE-family HTH domain
MAWKGATLRRLRLDKGLTQADLAEKARTTRVHIARLETGTRRPSVDLLPRLAQALDVPVEVLLR